jgi:DNA-binding SARP family transcriptional activator
VGCELPGTTIPGHRQRAVKPLVAPDLPHYNDDAMLEIRVIGELEVQLAGTRAELLASRRVRALLGWLAVHPGRHPRSRLAGQFWPDVLDASARASLRSAIWALRSALGPDFGSYLATDRDTVTLGGDGLWVDLREVRRLIAQGQPGAALDLCRGELLQELDDDWVVEARAELDRDVAAALRDLMEQATAAGDAAAAASWARRRAALCPLDESAGADLIRALLQAGDASAALAALATLRERLDSELGIGLSSATTALVSRLDRPAAGPGGADRKAHRGAGPAEPAVEPVTGLVGREQDFAGLVKAWQAARSGSGGVVLLEGEGGIGKTRLVEELRAAARRAAPDATLTAGTTAAGPGRAAPFAIWTDALSDLVSVTGRPPATLAGIADLARIVPALAPGTEGPGPATRTSADPMLARVQLSEAVVQFLAWVSGQAPLLLAFDDLHLSDLASLELIAYTGRRLRHLPVLLVLTRRRLPSRLDLDAVLGALRARGALVAEVDVRPLADDTARALIRASAHLPAATVEQIVTLAAGNPLLAVETARRRPG